MAELFKGCPPARMVEPLSPGFASAADRFLPVLKLVWRGALGFVHDPWQIDVIRLAFEIDPRTGHLRHRQFFVSLSRQQGKSELAAALAILALLMRPRGLVIGVASSADQARIVYERTRRVIDHDPEFSALFTRSTAYRGIATKQGGTYTVKAAKAGALQGLAIDLGVIDEVHLVKLALWTALVNGTGSRDDCLVFGITTAGDDTSELLKHLYSELEAGRIGGVIWEAPDRPEYARGKLPESDDVLWADLCAAGPAYATGRVARENVLADVRTLPPRDAIRFRLNRFVAGTITDYLPVALWAGCASSEQFPDDAVMTFGIARDDDWTQASVVAAYKVDDTIYTELVASVLNPSPAKLLQLAKDLRDKHPGARFALDPYTLRAVGKDIPGTVFMATLGEVSSAASLLYAVVAQQRLRHPSDQTLAVQLAGARRKNVGASFKIVPKDLATAVDAVQATALAVYFADTAAPKGPQLFT